MPLITYEQVRPWARAIKTRTGLGPRAGVMPPWFVEKDLGIQKFKNDISPTEAELARIAEWVDSGAPQGDPAHLPKPLDFDTSNKWTIGEPDLVLRGPDVTVPAIGPDRWTKLGSIPSGLTEDRYVSAVEVREVNDVPEADSTNTVGGRYVFHHLITSAPCPATRHPGTPPAAQMRRSTNWPVHEVGRNADMFAPEAGEADASRFGPAARLGAPALQRPRHEIAPRVRLQSSEGLQARCTGARACRRWAMASISTSKPNTADQELHSYVTLQEHTEDPDASNRTCMRPAFACACRRSGATTSRRSNCVGYDHNWVKQYVYADDAAPLLPKGTILHLIAFLDTTTANPNLADGATGREDGRRSSPTCSSTSATRSRSAKQQFQAEMAKRRANMKSRNDFDIACPSCWAPPLPPGQTRHDRGNQ